MVKFGSYAAFAFSVLVFSAWTDSLNGQTMTTVPASAMISGAQGSQIKLLQERITVTRGRLARPYKKRNLSYGSLRPRRVHRSRLRQAGLRHKADRMRARLDRLNTGIARPLQRDIRNTVVSAPASTIAYRSCYSWGQRCARRWGYSNRNYFGCLRYHGC